MVWQCLPYSGCKWLNWKEIDKFDINVISKNSLHGYILEGDLGYPNELHESHNDYPLVSKKQNHGMLSKYCSDILDECGINVGGINKLVTSLAKKGRYVLHYRNLKLYLTLKMTLVSVYKILEFKKSEWLNKYIDFNTNKRKSAVNSFKKMFLTH